MIVLGAVAIVAALITTRKERICISLVFGLVSFSAVMGILSAILVFIDGDLKLEFTSFPFFGPFSFVLDPLSALFLISISTVALVAAIYSIGYAQQYIGHYNVGKLGALFSIFFISMALVVAAGNVVLFLILWELMSLSSYLLVVYEHREEGVVSAGWLYFVMTHLGTACIAVSLLFLAGSAGSFDFGAIAQHAGAGMTDLVRSAVFLLALVGLGAKAGIVPLHVWLPQAHPAAPSNVSALMSGVMVKVAVYMFIRATYQLLGPGDVWWGLLVLFIGSATALLGVLHALVERDIKRSLAFSTVENIGIIFIALGASMAFSSYGRQDLAALALIACLLHILFHSLFKSLLFLGAGAVVHATKTRDMGRMGGLAKRMRYTSAFFFIGALSISAIPPFNGFVSEWLIFQSLLHSYSFHDVTVNLLIALALGMLALTGALAAACFVRLFGGIFLARPRDRAAQEAQEAPRSMLLAMSVLAVLCLGTGLLATQIIPYVDQASATVVGVSIGHRLTDGWVLEVDGGAASSVSPLLLAALIGLLLPAAILAFRFIGGRPTRSKVDTWDCGTPLDSRNEYTPVGYSQPIVRAFDVVYRSRTESSYDPASSPYSRRGIRFSTSFPRLFERYLYEPVARIVIGIAKRASVIQTGSIQTYLAYMFVTLVALLLIFR